MRLCTDCRSARDRWIYDSGRLIRPLGIKFASHAGWDDTAEGVAWRRRRRADDYYALVRQQLRLIADICARRHQVAPNIVPLPEPDVWGQYDLFQEAS